MSKTPELIPHLFRTEFRKITAVLCKLFGIDHIEVAEDLASETLFYYMHFFIVLLVPSWDPKKDNL